MDSPSLLQGGWDPALSISRGRRRGEVGVGGGRCWPRQVAPQGSQEEQVFQPLCRGRPLTLLTKASHGDLCDHLETAATLCRCPHLSTNQAQASGRIPLGGQQRRPVRGSGLRPQASGQSSLLFLISLHPGVLGIQGSVLYPLWALKRVNIASCVGFASHAAQGSAEGEGEGEPTPPFFTYPSPGPEGTWEKRLPGRQPCAHCGADMAAQGLCGRGSIHLVSVLSSWLTIP